MKSSHLPLLLVVCLLSALLSACVDRIPVDNRPCPCGEGYECCPSSNSCIDTSSMEQGTPWEDLCPPLVADSSVHDKDAGTVVLDGGTGEGGIVTYDGYLKLDMGQPCADEIQTLAAEIYSEPRACTAVVRLDYASYQVLGYQLICGDYAAVSEAQARAAAAADTAWGASESMLNPANPEDAYVFYQPAGDLGGAAVVSARTGLTVFGGSTIWMGQGTITYPKTWRAAGTIGSGCSSGGPVIPIPTKAGYDLTNGTSLTQSQITHAVTPLADTAIPGAFARGGYLFNTVVLLYPRTVGPMDPNTAEWIVLVTGGWLE
jgi:hypothetical protein